MVTASLKLPIRLDFKTILQLRKSNLREIKVVRLQTLGRGSKGVKRDHAVGQKPEVVVMPDAD